jgi:flagellar basal-body rod protein FlgB
MIQRLFPFAMEVLRKNLDLRHDRQRVLQSNIANAETPGFVAKDVQFEEVLRDAAHPTKQGALWLTHPRHLPQASPAVQEVQGRLVARPSGDVGRDLNTVSMDREMAHVTTNAMHYNASVDMLGRLLASIRRTIQEGRQ